MSNSAFDPFFALTPLYGFSSDLEDLVIGESFALIKYGSTVLPPLSRDDVLLKHFALHQPDYLLLQRASTDADRLKRIMAAALSVGYEGISASTSLLFYFPATNFFRLLRLFKAGRVITGDTFVLSSAGLPEGRWETLTGQRCSETALDYTLLNLPREPYTLSASELPFFIMFGKALLPQLEALRNPEMPTPPAPLEIALQLYNEDDHYEPRVVLSCLTALEALLTNESKAELSYRLSLRAANLLEEDDLSRLNRFKELRDFYDLRSQIVHGPRN
ncbi:MAG: hypothetical protein ACRD3B_01135 [Candidatus Sulfotelmatobacter sp.]